MPAWYCSQHVLNVKFQTPVFTKLNIVRHSLKTFSLTVLLNFDKHQEIYAEREIIIFYMLFIS